MLQALQTAERFTNPWDNLAGACTIGASGGLWLRT